MKRERRRAERKWKTSRSDTYFERFTFLLNESRSVNLSLNLLKKKR